MCGFVGFTDGRSPEEKRTIVEKMADRIVHRGPDSDGYFTDDVTALGFRRLSIVDLAGGNQPIFNEDESKVIVFNGEIYNHKELRVGLEEKGHIFKTNADTEVILHGYEEYGCDLFDKLRGMFAFVIYDKATGELVGARDYFGIKPFYYYKKDDVFLFASEIKGMLEHPDFVKEVNRSALKMYLVFQYSVFEETFFKNVFKLKPGHYFKYKDGVLETKPYFEIEYKKQDLGYDEHRRQIKEALENSIKYHQITADVEVGSYLSGGVDSSYVVGVARPDKTFTVGFDVQGFNETELAQEYSELCGINNYRRLITKQEFFDALPRVQYHTDEPEANLSAVPLLFLSGLASEKVKVVLSGEGSDEMFGGYNEYPETKGVKFYLALPGGLRRGMAKIAKKLPHFPGKNTIIKYSKPFCERYLGHAQIMDEEEANRILCDDLKDNITTTDVLRPYYEKVKDCDDVLQKMYIDMHFWLPQDILLKADKMTMANSLELRVPFLDKEVWKVASRVPSKYLVKGMRTKSIFRDVADEAMPADWSNRRKLGFPVPFSKWVLEEPFFSRVKEAFNKPEVDLFFDRAVINKLLDDHHKGVANNGRKIYNIYTFLIWYNVYFVEEANG
ncbi:MAG: asparagine synthase (glutamine-hydrolyzing) [Clostridia bacterium]|nr:asparagine synthase (glutamine-hydrolyzing) [Clostridia bacterium]